MTKKLSGKNEEILAQINEKAAGIDIGDGEIWLAVPEGGSEEAVRCYKSYTADMKAAVAWLVSCGIETVAMEATGIYWLTLHELLEEAGLEVYVVNSRHVKNVQGRKSDIVDCQWLQQLHTYGLLSASFHPDQEIRALRTLVRHRGMLVQYQSAHIQHMQKALQLMNIKLTLVLSDIVGVTGMQIIRAIAAGETDPYLLASYRRAGCKHSQAEIAKALTGNYRQEHRFTLNQALNLYDEYGRQMAACDEALERMYAQLADQAPPPQTEAPPPNKRKRRKNQPYFDLRQYLFQVYGVDLVAVDGLDTLTVQTLLSELGTDMSKWPTVKHFASWLGLAPNHKISGGKVQSRRTQKNTNRAAHALRLAAQSLARSQTSLGHFYRQIRYRHGPAKAVTATAHKLARIIYFMLIRQEPYRPPDLVQVKEAQEKRRLAVLERKARHFGFQLTPLPDPS